MEFVGSQLTGAIDNSLGILRGAANGDKSDESDISDNSEARHGAQVCKLLHDHKENSSACRAHVGNLRYGLRESGVAVEGR